MFSCCIFGVARINLRRCGTFRTKNVQTIPHLNTSLNFTSVSWKVHVMPCDFELHVLARSGPPRFMAYCLQIKGVSWVLQLPICILLHCNIPNSACYNCREFCHIPVASRGICVLGAQIDLLLRLNMTARWCVPVAAVIVIRLCNCDHPMTPNCFAICITGKIYVGQER